ncbi:single-stranded DNA-binding protein [Leptolyngbyaceae cyanobacterium CCMR0082]|uniref:Single-stranded DNA-binding protein n=2 Tax=Adonisia turfae TaxID=2950184 RepID=A0A6M0SDD9_9CYAN|nr:single-stranded DNA-binding protein [Adonisia turfae]MDV3350402.1 single-stranded DNA-binding protein [Leptothoe sp. LEGE 181152]NEZ60063.1 single-stranded DNA-binding protein [Adonisia turfae CCMR0081]NEZ65692.1 single-stranded DNA-binding protein [Adonisia turfae CCMR0082]
MNHCILMGEIVESPQLRYTSDNQTPIAEFKIKIAGLRPDDSPSQFKAVGWGNLAQTIQDASYGPGDRVVVEGRLTMKTVDRPEGFREKQAEITVQRLHRIAEMQSMLMAAAPPIAEGSHSGSRPAASTPQPSSPPTNTTTPDYDEIPF